MGEEWIEKRFYNIVLEEWNQAEQHIQQLEDALLALYKAVEHMDFSYEMGEGDKVEAVTKARAALFPSEASVEWEGEDG
jgi:hypothetical protein